MSTNIALASVSEIKSLVTSATVTPIEALARVDAVLSRKTLTDGKKARWTRLREWIVKSQTTDSVSA